MLRIPLASIFKYLEQERVTFPIGALKCGRVLQLHSQWELRLTTCAPNASTAQAPEAVIQSVPVLTPACAVCRIYVSIGAAELKSFSEYVHQLWCRLHRAQINSDRLAPRTH